MSTKPTWYVVCVKCGQRDMPRKRPFNTGTSNVMRCPDCCVPHSNPAYATMCRQCCPTGHQTRFIDPKADMYAELEELEESEWVMGDEDLG